MSETRKVEANFPGKLRPLFKPFRYKVLHGGRGSGKSWGVARALLIRAADKPIRVLCTREVQKSLKESVHALLSDQIQSMNLGAHFRVLDTEIRGHNGSRFIFSGLSSQTAESIKSYEAVDLVWVEEAQTVSKRSWDILTPTIRRPNSEIWATLNPYLATDETYARFVLNPPPDAWVQRLNYSDNPWFPEVLERERAHAEASMPEDEYRNIWLGEPLRAAAGAYYASQMMFIRDKGRVRDVPHQAGELVNTFWDLGWNDDTSIWFHQYIAGEDRFLSTYSNSGESIEHYAQYLQKTGWLFGTHYLPHDAESKSLQTGKSTLDILSDLLPGHRFEVVPRVDDVLVGIQQTRMKMVGPVYFDQKGCAEGLLALERYRKEWNEKQQVFRDKPLHDQFSNLADAFRQWGQGFMPPNAMRKRKPRDRGSWRAR